MPFPICVANARNKHFGFSNIRVRSRSIVELVCAVVVVAVRLHHQQSDDLYKIQKQNANCTGAIIYVWPFIVLSFGHSCICGCWTALRERVAYLLQRYWLLNLFTCPTLPTILFVRVSGWYWHTGLVTAGCLVVRLRLWQPWHPFRNSPNWRCLTLSLHHCQCQQSVLVLHLATANATSCLVDSLYANTHRTMKCWLGRNNLSMQQCFGYKHSPKVWEMKYNL
jgi:hypothetical protein